MKKAITVFLILALILLTACGVNNKNTSAENLQSQSFINAEIKNLEFSGLDDPDLVTYYDDTVYSQLVTDLDSAAYFVENVESKYISKEYIEEKLYNSIENIYFGYNLSELEAQFEGTKYVFTLDNDGQTTVKAFEGYDDSFEKSIIKNVAIGSGVILTCVTVSLVTGGTAPAISMIFAASAKTATTFAMSGSVISGVSAGVITGIKTKDFDKAITSAASKASEGFKWGAITGAISGGASKAIALKGTTLNGLTMNEAAAIQKESGYPLDVIKEFKNMEQYNICKSAGLKSQIVNGKTALIREIDTSYVDEMGRTNLERMKQGLAAIDPNTGVSYELHHIGQHNDSTLAILTKAEHMQGGNNKIWHELKPSEIDRDVFKFVKEDFWKSIANTLGA